MYKFVCNIIFNYYISFLTLIKKNLIRIIYLSLYIWDLLTYTCNFLKGDISNCLYLRIAFRIFKRLVTTCYFSDRTLTWFLVERKWRKGEGREKLFKCLLFDTIFWRGRERKGSSSILVLFQFYWGNLEGREDCLKHKFNDLNNPIPKLK